MGGKVVVTYATFSTPVATAGGGLVDDVPVGACFADQPPPNTEVCASLITQNFQVIYQGKTYPITTVATQLECWDGVRVSGTGNPVGKNFTYTLGTP